MLLLDHNLSARLLPLLADIYPSMTHVTLLGLERASDREVWNYAKKHQLAIVTKDSDFSDLSALFGAPPKIIWLRIGNSSTRDVAQLLRKHSATIHEFLNEPNAVTLEVIS